MKRFFPLLAAAALLLAGTTSQAQSLPADESIVAAAPVKPAGPAAAAATGTPAVRRAPARPVFVDRENQINYVTMSTRNDMAIFAGLDGMSSLKATVTNGEGRTIFATSVSAKKNAMNVSRLKPGLYYITLMNEFTGKRRAFVLNR